MGILLLILATLVLPAALFYLTVATNEFEKSTRALADLIQKRYTWEPPKKAEKADQPGAMSKIPGRPKF
jgi:hypothetical protein